MVVNQNQGRDLTSPGLVSTSKTQIENCPICGEPTGRILNMFGRNYIVPQMCKCKRKKRMEFEKLSEKKDKQMRLERMFANSLMTKDLKRYTFENWDHKVGNENMYKLGLKYIENFKQEFKKNIGLLIYGNPGNGKTYFSGCIANKLLEKFVPTVCVSAIGLLDRIKSTFSKYGDEGVQNVLNCMDNADLVIIDDLGVEVNTDWSRATMYQILNSRCDKKKPLIITTNFTLEQLKKRYDQYCPGWQEGKGRTFDRLVNEMCQPIENTASSIRVQHGKEKAKILNEILNS